MTRTPHRCNRARAPRAVAVYLFALLVALLALGAPQRVVRVLPSAPLSLTRTVERPDTLQTDAVRAQPSLRVARAPVLARLPVVLASQRSSRAPAARLLLTRASRVPHAQRVTHFHAKRRIPRMNSEEPPRG